MAGAIRNVLDWIQTNKPALLDGVSKREGDSEVIVKVMEKVGYTPNPELFSATYSPRDHSAKALRDHCRLYMSTEILEDFRLFMSGEYRPEPKRVKADGSADAAEGFDGYVWDAKTLGLGGGGGGVGITKIWDAHSKESAAIMDELVSKKIEDLPKPAPKTKKAKKKSWTTEDLDAIEPLMGRDETVTDETLAKNADAPKKPEKREADTSTLNEDWGGW